MKIDREISGDVAVLSLRGEFDSFVVSSFLEEIEALAASGIHRVVLDMRLVKFIMSTAIGAVVKARKMLRELGGDLVVAQPSGFVRDVLESLGLTQVLRIYDSNGDAVRNLGSGEAAELPPGNSALLRFEDPEIDRALDRKPVVARILDLGEERMRVETTRPPNRFPPGARLTAKFRLPLFKKAYYFAIPAELESAEPSELGSQLVLRFTEVGEEDRRSIRQFVADMNFLREEVKRAGQER